MEKNIYVFFGFSKFKSKGESIIMITAPAENEKNEEIRPEKAQLLFNESLAEGGSGITFLPINKIPILCGKEEFLSSVAKSNFKIKKFDEHGRMIYFISYEIPKATTSVPGEI